MLTQNFILICSAIFGACIGSFLNVCILRIPKEISIVFPPSTCPKCNYQIKWYDNIPVLSYIFLRGRCRSCKNKISIQYPVVEAITAFFGFYSILFFSFSINALVVFFFLCILIIISFIDLEHKIIPNILSIPGIPIFFILSYFTFNFHILDLILGVLIGGGSLFLVAFLYKAVTGKDGMGFGDVKLLAMIGAFIGFKGVFFTIFASSLIGTITGLLLIALKGKNMTYALPFGPFLTIGAIIYLFHGNFLIDLYFNTFMF